MLRYAITDRRLFGGDEQARRAGLLQYARLAADRNIDFLQVREKDLPAAQLAEVVRELAAGLAGCGVKLLVNGRCDIAIAGGAEGVHLTSSPGELTPGEVRRLFARARQNRPVVSLSGHTLAEVRATAARPQPDRPDLILFGPVFEKRLDEVRVLAGSGLERLREACTEAAPIPVLALGGVTPDRAAQCLAAGAAGIAAIRMFLPASWPE